jgi:hypothetical protein
MSSRKKPNPNERMYAADNRPTFGPSRSEPATKPLPTPRSRAQNVPGVPAKGQGLDDFTRSRMEQSRAATANKTPATPTRPETPRPPTPSVTPPDVTSRPPNKPTPPRPVTPPDVTSRPTRPTPMPTRSLGSGPTAPVNMGKLNQINSMVAGRPSPTPARGTPMRPMKTGGSVNSSASKRADGIATRGKTKGKMC